MNTANARQTKTPWVYVQAHEVQVGTLPPPVMTGNRKGNEPSRSARVEHHGLETMRSKVLRKILKQLGV